MKIKVLLVMPNKEAQLVRMPANLKFIKSIVGDNLFTIKLDDNTSIIASRNANIDEFNRFLGGNIIVGTFLVVSMQNNRLYSMKKRDIRRYTNMFKIRKHIKKVEFYKDQFLELYYSNQFNLKQKRAMQNKNKILKLAA